VTSYNSIYFKTDEDVATVIKQNNEEKRLIFGWHLEGHKTKEQNPKQDSYQTDPENCN
jgi:hypothetical protein